VLAVQELWHSVTELTPARRYTVAGMGSPRESVEQHRGVIPRRVKAVARSCSIRALNARTREQERGRRVRGSPRARRTSPEGGALLRRLGGPQGATEVAIAWCACFRFVGQFMFCVFCGFKRVSLDCLGGPYGCP
jgi:hypothetical protein